MSPSPDPAPTQVSDLGSPAWEYAPAPEARDVVSIAASYGLFVDGTWVDPVDGDSFKTGSPSSEEVLSEVAEAGPADVERAVEAARRAFGRWSRLAGAERGKRWLGGLLVLLGVLVLSGADRQLEALAIGLLPDWATSI